MKNFRPPFHVDFHSERGEVTIYVTDADGKDVWYADTDAVNQLVEDGFISTRGFAMGRNMRPDVLERSVLDYLRSSGVITNELSESRRYFADEQDSLYDENPRRRNPNDVHIDIHSHNTRGRGVRASNPRGERPSYQVIVSNMGTLCDTYDRAEAMDCFNEYVDIVSSPRGRASGESVTLMFDGEILKEYQNEFQSHRQGTRYDNPTQTDVENWTERYRASVQKRVDGVPSQAQYVVKIVTTKGETAFLRVGKGTKFDTDANSARVYRSGEKANEAATKVSNWLKKKNPAKWKAIKSISAEPKK
jgi:hypothetical protein